MNKFLDYRDENEMKEINVAMFTQKSQNKSMNFHLSYHFLFNALSCKQFL